METAVIFNMGRDAYRAGQDCVAPATVAYPLQTRWHNENGIDAGHQVVSLNADMQREWRRGWFWRKDDRGYAACCRREKAAA